ncbi:MAG: PAS domain S-box protein [Spirochaetales bacterium]|nr:PAS domain S-box protein [Leptospiraceae bacterium]MCP5481114.1 PAS domain S-box protein [Spirochaetales bacterium]
MSPVATVAVVLCLLASLLSAGSCVWNRDLRFVIPTLLTLAVLALVLVTPPQTSRSEVLFVTIGALLLLGSEALRRTVKSSQSARERLSDRDARISAILDTAVDCIIIIDDQGRIEEYNNAAERLFGYTRRETLGRNVSMLMAEPHRSAHDSYIRNFLNSRQPRIIGSGREVPARRKDGEEFPVYLAVSEVLVGSRRYFAGILHDLTDLKAKEADLLLLSARLMSVQEEERSRIAREIHDVIGQSLIALKFFVAEIEYEFSEVAGLGTRCRTVTEQINAIVRQARDLSHNLSPIALTEIGLAHAVRELIERMPRHGDLKIELDLDHIDRWPTLESDIHVYRIIQEAVLNAIKHSGASHILVVARKAGDRLHITVSDNGVGFTDAPEAIGPGLGLRIMKERAAALNGILRIARSGNQGAEVVLDVPFRR